MEVIKIIEKVKALFKKESYRFKQMVIKKDMEEGLNHKLILF